MLPTTLEATTAIFRADVSIAPAERAHLLALLRQPFPNVSEPGPRILRRAEVARRFSVSTRSIDKLAFQGLLKKVHFPGRSRAAGFLESDVTALIGGAK